MSLVDDVVWYYAARGPVYDETAGYTDPEAEQMRGPIKARYRDMFRGRTVLEIACGTGYWSRVIGEVAASMLAIDINPSLIAIAQQRCRHLSRLTFQAADAYILKGVQAGFDAALGIWWWSHVPKALLPRFLGTLHSKLDPGALVLFVDELPYEGCARRRDSQGNSLEERVLPDGRKFEIVKNFPAESEVRVVLADIAQNVTYFERPAEKSWNVMYNVKK